MRDEADDGSAYEGWCRMTPTYADLVYLLSRVVEATTEIERLDARAACREALERIACECGLPTCDTCYAQGERHRAEHPEDYVTQDTDD